MKKVFTSLFVAFLVINAQAKIVYLNNNLENPKISENLYTNWADAYAAASVGDTIYVVGSNFDYGRITIEKKLTVIGPGYFLEGNTQTQVDKKEAMFNQVTLKEGSDGTLIKGLSINGGYGLDISDQIDDITIENNYCYDITFNFRPQDIYNNISIKKCFIKSNLSMASGYDVVLSNLTLTNNFINGVSIEDGSTGIVSRNLFLGNDLKMGTSSSFEITDNIFLNDNVNSFTIQNLPDASVHNNISLTGAFGDANGNMTAPQSTLFTTDENATTDGQYMLSESSPAKGAGTNGTDIGPFGGPDPYRLSGLPDLPNIYELSTGGFVSGDEMPVQIKIKQ